MHACHRRYADVPGLIATVRPFLFLAALALLTASEPRAQTVQTAPSIQAAPITQASQSAPTTTAPSAVMASAAAPPAEPPGPPPLKPEELDALLAPVALYPDQLLSQVFIASTYPLEVVQVHQWLQQNSTLQGDAQLGPALEQQPWDPSVKALASTRTVLQQMAEKIDWTQKLGDAFLAQQGDVMDSVQRLRMRAQEAGQLKDTEQQKIVTTNQTIVIQPANPEVIYVPSYNPAIIYGAWPYSAYPPYYWPPAPGYAFGAGIAFGIGVGITAAVWGNAFNWGGREININSNRNVNINGGNRNNIGNGNSQRWEHNSEHRRGVNYKDQGTRERYGKGNATAANARRDFRGQGQGQGAGQLGQRAGQGSLERRGQSGAFSDAGSGARQRAESNRGRSSRQSYSQNAGNRGGARAGGGGGGGRGGGRGGGGGRR